MPRDLSTAVLTELASVTLQAPIYAVRVTRGPADVFRWSERPFSVTYGSPSTTETWSDVRLQDLQGLDFAPDHAGAVTIVVANVDKAITTYDQTKSFKGAQIDILAYMPGVGEMYTVGSYWSDEITQISAESATFTAYPTMALPNMQIPKRTIGLACTNVFGNTANWNSVRDFEGSECPYQRVSTIGFFAGLVGDIDASVTSITVYWGTTVPGLGGKFSKGDRIKLFNEIMLITNSPADPDGSFQQTLTVQRGYLATTAASHTDNTPVYFNNCGYDVGNCTRRGMYGNNTSDSYTV